MFWSAVCSLLGAERCFSCSLDVLYGGLGVSTEIAIFIIKTSSYFSWIFFHFLVIKALDPDWIWIRIGSGSGLDLDPDWIWNRIGIQPKMLDPDPDLMNLDPKQWRKGPHFLMSSYVAPDPFYSGPFTWHMQREWLLPYLSLSLPFLCVAGKICLL